MVKASAVIGREGGSGAMVPEVRTWLGNESVDRVLVACSGGADSVFLLCQLWALREDLGLEVVVGHYNHAWRGEASDQDAVFVKAVAAGLGLESMTDTRPKEVEASTETQARALRLKFLRQVAQRSGCRAICFGHQRDDILETQLQRLVRGAGVEGLAAPRPVHVFEETAPVHLRPLLTLSAGALLDHLSQVGIPWREDASNADTAIARNALRKKIIPELEGMLGRDVSAGAARTRRLLEADAVALAELARVALPEAYTGEASLNRNSLRALPEAFSRRALAGLGVLASMLPVSMPLRHAGSQAEVVSARGFLCLLTASGLQEGSDVLGVL